MWGTLDESYLRLKLPLVPFSSVTTSDGNAAGTTVVASALLGKDAAVFNSCGIILTSGTYLGFNSPVTSYDTVTGTFTLGDPLGAAIVAGTRFAIVPSEAFSVNVTLVDTLVYVGQCSAGMSGSKTTFDCPDLVGHGNDRFNTQYVAIVLKNDNAVGAAPEGESSDITDYVSATGTFTVSPGFSANIEASDVVMILRKEVSDMRVAQGLAYKAKITGDAAGSTTTHPVQEMTNFGDDYFNNGWVMRVIRNANSVGNAPEQEFRDITDYVSATGVFTTAAFSAAVEADDDLLIIRKDVADQVITQGMFWKGKVDGDAAGSTTVHPIATMAAFGDDLFNTDYVMVVLKNADGVGTAPEGEVRDITDYVSASGTFTTVAFSGAVEAGDDVLIARREYFIIDGVPVKTTPIADSLAAQLINTIQIVAGGGTGFERDATGLTIYKSLVGVTEASWQDGTAQQSLADMPHIKTVLRVIDSPQVDQDSMEVADVEIHNLRPDADKVQTTEYSGATLSIYRYRLGVDTDWTAVVTTQAMTEAAGHATYDYTFPGASWQNGDLVKYEVDSLVVEIPAASGQIFTVPPLYDFGVVGGLSAIMAKLDLLQDAFWMADHDEFDVADATPVSSERWEGENYVGAAEDSDADIDTTTSGKAYVIADPDATPVATGYWLRQKPVRQSRHFTAIVDLDVTWGTEGAGDLVTGMMVTKAGAYDANNNMYVARRKDTTPTDDLVIDGTLNGVGLTEATAAVTSDAIALRIDRIGDIWRFYYSLTQAPTYQWIFVGQYEDTGDRMGGDVSLALYAYSPGVADAESVQGDFDNFKYYVRIAGLVEIVAGDYDSSHIAGNIDGSVLEILEAIVAGHQVVAGGGTGWEADGTGLTEYLAIAGVSEAVWMDGTAQQSLSDMPFIKQTLTLQETQRVDQTGVVANIALHLENLRPDSDVIQTTEYSGTTITIARFRLGTDGAWNNIVTTQAMTETNGWCYYDYTFPSASWQAGDLVRVTTQSCVVEIPAGSGQIYTLGAMNAYGVVGGTSALIEMAGRPGIFTATASSTTSLTAAALVDVASSYLGQMAVPLEGNMVGQARTIMAFDGTQAITVAPAWAADPGSVRFAVIPSDMKTLVDTLGIVVGGGTGFETDGSGLTLYSLCAGVMEATWLDGTSQQSLADYPIIEGKLDVQIDPRVDQANMGTAYYQIKNLRPDADVVQTTEYSGCLISIARFRLGTDAGWTNVVTTQAMTENAGYASYPYTYPNASWEPGDLVRYTVAGCVVEIPAASGQIFTLPTAQVFSVIGGASALIQALGVVPGGGTGFEADGTGLNLYSALVGVTEATFLDGTALQSIADMPVIHAVVNVRDPPRVDQPNEDSVELSLRNLRTDGDVIQTTEYSGTNVSIARMRLGVDAAWNTIVNSAAMTEGAGRATYNYTFPSASWQPGDLIRYIVFGCIVEIPAGSGQTFYIPDIYTYGVVGGTSALVEMSGRPFLGESDAATVNTLTCAELTATADQYVGQMVVPLEGATVGLGRMISAYDGTSVITVVPDWPSDPDAGGDVRFTIIPVPDYFNYTAGKGLEAIFDIVDGIPVLTRVGGTHDQSDAAGTEDTLWISDAPGGNWTPERFIIDLTEMAAADNLTVKVYYRMTSGGNYILHTSDNFLNAQAIDCVSWELLQNRFGVKITTTQSAGVARDWIWETYYGG